MPGTTCVSLEAVRVQAELAPSIEYVSCLSLSLKPSVSRPLFVSLFLSVFLYPLLSSLSSAGGGYCGGCRCCGDCCVGWNLQEYFPADMAEVQRIITCEVTGTKHEAVLRRERHDMLSGDTDSSSQVRAHGHCCTRFCA